jgi:MoxR-like ATPase
MRARVKNGRWVLDDPTDLPEGTEVEIVTRPAPPKASMDVYLDDKLRQYIRALLVAACAPKYSATRVAASAKDEEELAEAAKAAAFGANRRYTTPEDIKKVAPDVLRRFVVLPAEATRGRDVLPDDMIRTVIRAILDATEVP